MRSHLRLTGLLVIVTGCPHQPAPGESVDEVCSLDKHETEVHVSGYLMPPVLTIGCVESCSMSITSSRSERYGVSATFPVGDGPRTMAGIQPLEGATSPGELKRIPASAYRLTDDDGRNLGPGDVVRMTGTLRASQGDSTLHCSLEATSVRGL